MISSLLLAPALMLHVTSEQVRIQVRHPYRTSRNADPDRVICKQANPNIGSRVEMRRMCMTRAQWRVHEQALSAMRRDLQGGPGYRDVDGE